MKKINLFTLFICAILLSGCPDENNIKPEPIDPCANSTEVSADFFVYERPNIINDTIVKWRFVDTDTLGLHMALFKAKLSNAEYEWHIGSEIYNTREVTLNNLPVNYPIKIKLIVRKEPNLDCFPLDDGIDSLTRIIRVIPKDLLCNNDVISGTFSGYIDKNSDSLRLIEINVCALDSISKEKTIKLSNLHPNVTISYWNRQFSIYKQAFFLSSDYKLLRLTGLATVFGSNNDSIIIEYNHQKEKKQGIEDVYNRESHTFIGRRVE
jgi:hypothetical protein